MPRPGGGRVNEKSKDFFGSIKRLLKHLNPWKYVVISALVLAMISAILSLIAPNKLSDFTDVITEGLKPNTAKLEEIGNAVSTNFTKENFETKIPNILIDSSIPEEDIRQLQEVLVTINETKDENEIKDTFLSLPDTILLAMMEDIKIDN